MSNQRQINFSYQIQREQNNQRLDQTDIYDWWAAQLNYDMGGPVWNCPALAYTEKGGNLGATYFSYITNYPSSYAFNWHLLQASMELHRPWGNPSSASTPSEPIPVNVFRTEGQVQRPALTPVLADGLAPYASPFASDQPPTNLTTDVYYDGGGFFAAVPPYSGASMAAIATPRHGDPPTRLPAYWPPNRPLPGSVNVAFFDGHGELVKLDRLWQLYWHVNYQPPARRPGIP